MFFFLYIQSRDCVNLGPPEVGEAVQVKWPDGLFYGAKYLGSNVSHMYQVRAPERIQSLFFSSGVTCVHDLA